MPTKISGETSEPIVANADTKSTGGGDSSLIASPNRDCMEAAYYPSAGAPDPITVAAESKIPGEISEPIVANADTKSTGGGDPPLIASPNRDCMEAAYNPSAGAPAPITVATETKFSGETSEPIVASRKSTGGDIYFSQYGRMLNMWNPDLGPPLKPDATVIDQMLRAMENSIKRLGVGEDHDVESLGNLWHILNDLRSKQAVEEQEPEMQQQLTVLPLKMKTAKNEGSSYPYYDSLSFLELEPIALIKNEDGVSKNEGSSHSYYSDSVVKVLKTWYPYMGHHLNPNPTFIDKFLRAVEKTFETSGTDIRDVGKILYDYKKFQEERQKRMQQEKLRWEQEGGRNPHLRLPPPPPPTNFDILESLQRIRQRQLKNEQRKLAEIAAKEEKMKAAAASAALKPTPSPNNVEDRSWRSIIEQTGPAGSA